jgi:hypothetical protein
MVCPPFHTFAPDWGAGLIAGLSRATSQQDSRTMPSVDPPKNRVKTTD